MEIHVLTTEEIEALLEKAATRGAKEALKTIHREEMEKPVPRSVAMEILKVKSIKTFNNRVKANNAISCGKIGSEPAYYLSQFFKIAS
jgi:hypothetical protein